MLTLHDNLDSGNAYKVRWILAQRGIPFRRIETSVDDGTTRSPAFRAINPNGKVPTLVLADGTVLTESNAILVYFAEGTRFWPETGLARAQALGWMFFEQYTHEPAVAVPRFILRHLAADHPRRGELPGLLEKGAHALGVMEGHLAGGGGRDWFVGTGPTTADIALYAYTHVAGQGGFDLEPYPAIRGWLDRFAGLPGHVPLDWQPAAAS